MKTWRVVEVLFFLRVGTFYFINQVLYTWKAYKTIHTRFYDDIHSIPLTIIERRFRYQTAARKDIGNEWPNSRNRERKATPHKGKQSRVQTAHTERLHLYSVWQTTITLIPVKCHLEWLTQKEPLSEEGCGTFLLFRQVFLAIVRGNVKASHLTRCVRRQTGVSIFFLPFGKKKLHL